jgi:serine/threonine protein kinase
MSRPPANKPLPKGFQLDRYRIDRQLSTGGFSFVYLAYDGAGAAVAIKEYLPCRLVQRQGDSPLPTVPAEYRGAFNLGMKSFFEEARVLAHIDHPNVVQVLNFFRANETAYMVMRYENGHSLQQHVLALKENGETINEDFLRNVFVHLLSGLREVHRQKLLHLDIKPANIYLRNDGQPVLLDFGATRHGLGDGNASLEEVHTPGFAAPEQENSGEPLGPWTDIYSIGATLHACLAGNAPPPAGERMAKDELEPAQQRWPRRYSAQLLELIDWCLRLPIAERPQSVFALQKVLNGDLLDLVDPNWFETAD